MDLRAFEPSEKQREKARNLLTYQPFRIGEQLQSGVGYSWLYETDLNRLNLPQLLFDASRDAPERWRLAVDASEKLARSYQVFLDAIVSARPRGSYLDLCCNNGYMPVGASIRGMDSTGVDAGDFSAQIALLNEITGANAKFIQSEYRLDQRGFNPAIGQQFDVVSNMAFLIHVAEPLPFLRAVAELARHAVFWWSTFPPSADFIIRLPKPNQFSNAAFPLGFDAGVAISDSLLIWSMRELGFPRVEEIHSPADGWPSEWDNPLMRPYQPLRGFLFTR